jgi:hypothetical protein
MKPLRSVATRQVPFPCHTAKIRRHPTNLFLDSSLPKWMDDEVSASGLSLSRVLQDALKERLVK